MSVRALATQSMVAASSRSDRSSLLQRLCACDTHTSGGLECAAYSKKKLGLQRKFTFGVMDDPLKLIADRIVDRMWRFRGTSYQVRRRHASSDFQKNLWPSDNRPTARSVHMAVNLHPE
jgi:hypothetical protein